MYVMRKHIKSSNVDSQTSLFYCDAKRKKNLSRSTRTKTFGQAYALSRVLILTFHIFFMKKSTENARKVFL